MKRISILGIICGLVFAFALSGCGNTVLSVKQGSEDLFQIDVRKVYPEKESAELYIHQDGVMLTNYIGKIASDLFFLGVENNLFYIYSYNLENNELKLFADVSTYTMFFRNVLCVIDEKIFVSAATERGNVLLQIDSKGKVSVKKECPWGAWHGAQFGKCGKYLTCSYDQETGRALELYNIKEDTFTKVLASELEGLEDGTLKGEDLLAGFGGDEDGFYFQSIKLENNTINDLSEATVCFYDLKTGKKAYSFTTDHVNNFVGGDKAILFASEYEYDYPINPGVLYLISGNEAIKISVDTSFADWNNIRKTKASVYVAEAAKKLFIVDVNNKTIIRYEAWERGGNEIPSYQIQLYDEKEESLMVLFQGDFYKITYQKDNNIDESDTKEAEQATTETETESVKQVYLHEDEIEFETVYLKVDTKFDGITSCIILPEDLFFEEEQPAFVYSNTKGVIQALQELKTGDCLTVRVKGDQMVRYDETHPCQVEVVEFIVTNPTEKRELSESVIQKVQSYYEFEVVQ